MTIDQKTELIRVCIPIYSTSKAGSNLNKAAENVIINLLNNIFLTENLFIKQEEMQAKERVEQSDPNQEAESN